MRGLWWSCSSAFQLQEPLLAPCIAWQLWAVNGCLQDRTISNTAQVAWLESMQCNGWGTAPIDTINELWGFWNILDALLIIFMLADAVCALAGVFMFGIDDGGLMRLYRVLRLARVARMARLWLGQQTRYGERRAEHIPLREEPEIELLRLLHWMVWVESFEFHGFLNALNALNALITIIRFRILYN